MNKQRQEDQLKHTYNSSVPIQDIALKTCREQWTIETGVERGSGRSVLAVQHYDDDDDDLWVVKGSKVTLHPLFLIKFRIIIHI